MNAQTVQKWYTRVIGLFFLSVFLNLVADYYQFGYRPESWHKLFHTFVGVGPHLRVAQRAVLEAFLPDQRGVFPFCGGFRVGASELRGDGCLQQGGYDSSHYCGCKRVSHRVAGPEW